MKKMYGWDYFKKLELNKPRIGRSINDTVTMLKRQGELGRRGPLATTLQSKDKATRSPSPTRRTAPFFMISPSSILKNAPAPNTAKLFMSTCCRGTPTRSW